LTALIFEDECHLQCRCHQEFRSQGVCAPRPSAKRPCNLRKRLDEGNIAELITAYHQGATAASLGAHGLSLNSRVKRLAHRRWPLDLTHATRYEGNAGRTHP
jgi:hypothetical protein